MRIIAGRHVGATADGEVALTLRGPAGCEGIVTLKSERRVASRWLERGRPHVVTLARRRFRLPADGCSELILKLSPEHLALLRRMGAIAAVARVDTANAHAAKGVIVHAPARRRPARCTTARAAGAGIALMLACAPAALASWSPPDTLSSPGISLQPTGTPTLGIDARGNALALWARSFGHGWRLARRPSGAGVFGPERAGPYLGDEVVDRELPVPLVYGSGQAVALEQRKGRSTCGGLATRYVLTARSGSRLAGARHVATIISHQQPPPLAFAGNRSGTAIAAWIEYPSDAHGRCVRSPGEVLKAAVHQPGAGFGAPVTLIRGVVSQTVAVAVGERGDMLVAIRRKDSLETRSRGPSGRWSAPRRLAIADQRVDALHAAIAPDGAAWLLWSSGRSGVRTVSGAVRRPRTTSFRGARVLERSVMADELVDSPERWRLRISSPERGTGAAAAWTSSDGVHLHIMTAVARGDDPLEPPARLTPAGEDFVLGDLAVGAGRRAVALISRPADGPERALVSVAGGIAPFGALEPVGQGAGRVGGEALAIDPVTRRPTFVWTEVRPGAGTSPVTTVFASTRS
jgi:hypothetical protein